MISEYEDDYLIEFDSEKDIDKLREDLCWEVPTQEEFIEYLKSDGKKCWKNHKKGMKE